MIDRLLDYEINLLGFSMSGRKLVKHPLFSGSAVMIIGSNITNFLAYTYHLIIGRLLGPAPYGVLATMLSLMGLVSTAFSFFGLVIVKFVSSSEENELPGIYHWFKGIIFKFGLLFSGLALLTIPFLTGFLKIDAIILLLLAPMFLISIMVFFYRSILQGLLRFKEVVISTNSDMLGRLLFGLAAYYLGYSVFGVTVGIVMGSFVSLILLRYFIRDKEESKPKSKFKGTKKVFKYSVPVIVTTLSIQSFFSTDLILVKHFFPEHTAGIYASLSNLGKIIFYGTAPVLMVMFPLVSKRHAKGMGYKKIVILSMLLTAGIAGGVTLIYYLYPELMVLMLYGEKFIEGAQYLVWFGIFMTAFSLTSLLLNFYLSKEDTKIVFLTPIAVILQITGISLFHESIVQVVTVSIAAISMLLTVLLIYFAYGKKGKRKTKAKAN